MCNLYSQTRNVEAIRRRFNVSRNRATSIEPQPAIFPDWNGGVIRKSEDGERELLTMSWGFVLLQPGNVSPMSAMTRSCAQAVALPFHRLSDGVDPPPKAENVGIRIGYEIINRRIEILA